ncbi:zinc finger CCCH domain protein [Medicago truncatula]|uniref:Zinc finger CCCH domain protein n=2 Tax=Medicago truncatula TaxID=3880 RepID=G7J7X1_MEDTR|nr:zinc finger CCCH domain protein [Medicago truncatula]
MVKKNNKRKKEEIAEGCCFSCKDGGQMRVCDSRDCFKAYHAECVKQDASFLTNDNRWCCGSHFCYLCGRASKFRCFCCPIAVCGKCFYDAEFATVKTTKGFCRHCSKLAFLIETNADIDSDGEKIDMRDPDTVESYFLEYYQVIKKKEGWNSQDVYIARDIIKNGNIKRDLEPYERGEGEDTGESDASDFIGSDSDDLVGTSRVKPVKRKKNKVKSINGKVTKDKKKDFVGWGSRSLIDFLKNIGEDTTKAFSEIDVASIIHKYCQKNQLFDPKKKKMVICDANLITLLRQRTINKNNIQKLLASHFADNFEETDSNISSSEERDDNEAFKFRKHRNLNSTIKSCQNVRSKELPSGFAGIISSNIKLVYLKRSLIEELLKQPDTFAGKVLGSYVRTKSDPNDYLQKNSHLLLEVTGIRRSSNQDEINQEILLRLSNVPKDVSISQISDVDFSEEECQDLYQRMTNGQLKKPTLLELEQKARTLHEDITKHWISREIELLRNRIDRANEKGWRREYPFYMDQKQKLESASEQSRLLSEIPKVIPELVGTNLSPEDSSRKDKFEQNDLQVVAIGETCNSGGQYSTHNGFALCLDKRTDVVGPKSPVKNNQDDPVFPATVEQLSVLAASEDKDDGKPALLKESNSNCQTLNPKKCGLPQPSTTSASEDVDCRNLSINMDANHTVKERRSVTVSDPVKAIINDVIVLSDSDEEDVNSKVTSSGRKGAESIDIPIWYCSGVRGCGTRGPFPMTVLKHWSELDSTYAPLDFKVWKTGESEREAMLLRDALKLFFP